MAAEHIIGQVILIVLALLGVTVVFLRNQGKAQSIINNRYETLSKRLDAREESFANLKVQYAEERGGLRAQIEELQKRLDEERKSSESRSKENVERIVALETQLVTMKEVQAQLQERLDKVSAERDQINTLLNETKAQLAEAQQLVNALTAKSHQLETLLQQKDAEIADLRARLGTTGGEDTG